MFIIPSQSMEDTLEINDRVVAMKIVKYERGDIVVFEDTRWTGSGRAPAEEPRAEGARVRGRRPGIGRPVTSSSGVIGLPGDHVMCCSATGRITVNGVAPERGVGVPLSESVDGTR